MIEAVLLTKDGSIQEVKLRNPVLHGWAAFHIDVAEAVSPDSYWYINPHLVCFVGREASTEEKPVAVISGTDIYPPSLIVGNIWTDKNEPEPVSLTETQRGMIRKTINAEQ